MIERWYNINDVKGDDVMNQKALESIVSFYKANYIKGEVCVIDYNARVA